MASRQGMAACPISAPPPNPQTLCFCSLGSKQGRHEKFGVQEIRDAVRPAQRCWKGRFCRRSEHQGEGWGVSAGGRDALELLHCGKQQIKR